MRSRGGDDGQIALFVLGAAVVAAALVLTAAAITQVHLGRQQLRSVADAAALDASQALDQQTYYAVGTAPGTGVPVSSATVRAAVSADVADGAADSARLRDLRVVDPTGSPDARTAEVTMTAVVRPWLLPAFVATAVPDVRLQVTSRARSGLVLP